MKSFVSLCLRQALRIRFRSAVAVCCNLFLACTASAQNVSSSPGAVFTATNSADHNEIIMFHRNSNGTLRFVGKFPTGNRGEGGINDPLQSQSSILLSPDHRYLLAVNAGSSSISVFRVSDSRLTLLSATRSEGGNPVSIAMHDDLVYVINFGGTYHTAGFRLEPWGELKPIPNSKRPLSGLDTEPSTIAFSPDGSKLVLSERQTNKIDVFTVASNGSISDAVFNNSVGMEPFGLQFTPAGVLLVTSPTGSTSSYIVNSDNSLSVISPNSPSSGKATCWIATNGVHAWVTNSASSSVSAYALATTGALDPLGVVAIQPAIGPVIFPKLPPTSFPFDTALSADSQYLYVAYSALGRIFGYKTEANGRLSVVDSVSAFPPQSGAQGIAAY